MANLCFNKVFLIGDNDKLQKIVDAYNSIHTKYKTLETIQEILQLDCSDWGRSYDDGVSLVEIIKDRTLVIECTTAWSSVDAYWDALKEHLGLDTWASYSELDSEVWVTNDPDKIYFPDEYLLDVYDSSPYDFDDDRYFFKSQKDFVAFMNGKTKENHKFKYYENLINEDSEWGILVTIERCNA